MKKTKQEEIIDGLEDEVKLKCPFCKNDRFFRSAIEEPVLVEMWDDGEGVRDEDIGTCITEYTYVCSKCKKDVTEEELIK